MWLCRHNCQILCVLQHAFALSPVMSSVWLSGRCHFQTLFRYVEMRTRCKQQQFKLTNGWFESLLCSSESRFDFFFSSALYLPLSFTYGLRRIGSFIMTIGRHIDSRFLFSNFSFTQLPCLHSHQSCPDPPFSILPPIFRCLMVSGEGTPPDLPPDPCPSTSAPSPLLLPVQTWRAAESIQSGGEA